MGAEPGGEAVEMVRPEQPVGAEEFAQAAAAGVAEGGAEVSATPVEIAVNSDAAHVEHQDGAADVVEVQEMDKSA